MAEKLGERYRVITPDMIGHGLSDHPEQFTLEDQGKAVLGIIDKLCGGKAAVVGISMGTYIAAQAAILDSTRIQALVLLVTKAHGKTSSIRAYLERKGIDFSSLTSEELMDAMQAAPWAPATTSERRAAIMAPHPVAVDLDAEEKACVDASLAGFDLRPDLPRITTRTLVIVGEHDGFNPPAAGREVADLIPGAQFRVYENSGHMLADEEQDRLVGDLTAFIGVGT